MNHSAYLLILAVAGFQLVNGSDCDCQGSEPPAAPSQTPPCSSPSSSGESQTSEFLADYFFALAINATVGAELQTLVQTKLGAIANIFFVPIANQDGSLNLLLEIKSESGSIVLLNLILTVDGTPGFYKAYPVEGYQQLSGSNSLECLDFVFDARLWKLLVTVEIFSFLTEGEPNNIADNALNEAAKRQLDVNGLEKLNLSENNYLNALVTLLNVYKSYISSRGGQDNSSTGTTIINIFLELLNQLVLNKS